MLKKLLLIMFLVNSVLATTEDNYAPIEYDCDGSTTEFTFSYPVGATSDLEVILKLTSTELETVLTEDTHYTVSATNNNYSSGGTVTTISTYANTYTLTIRRDTAKTQDAILEDTRVLRLAAIEDGLDKLTRLFQDLQEIIDRCIKIPKTEDSTVELPSILNRSNKNLTSGSDGNITASSVLNTGTANISAFGETFIDDVDGSAGLTTLGLTNYIKTLVDDATALEARGTLGVISGVDIRVFGADGGDDDTIAIQAAIDSLGVAGGEVFFPIGVWKFTQLTVAQENITLKGEGLLSILQSTYAGSCLTISADYTTLESLVLDGTNRTASSVGISLATNRIDFFVMRDVTVMKFDIGIKNTTGSLITHWYNVDYQHNNYGLDYEPTAFSVTEHNWYGGRIYYNRKVGALFKNDGGSIGNLNWYGVIIESNGVDGSGDREGLQLHGVTLSNFNACRFEDNYANHISMETSNVPSSSVIFTMCNIPATDSGNGGVDIDSGASIAFINCDLSGHTFDCSGGDAVLVRDCREATMTWVDTSDIILHLNTRLGALQGYAHYGALATSPMLSTYVLADADERLTIRADGQMRWGNGTDALDTNLKRAAAGVLKTDDTFVPGGAVGTMTDNETFGPGDGNIFIKDPGGAGRNFNPDGTFQALHKVTVVNTADAAETITFDSATLNQAIDQNERGIFVYTGTAWLKIYVGS